MKVPLQVCGVNANPVWVLAFQDSPHVGFVPLIAGSDTNFSDPQVLTAGFQPTQQLYTWPLRMAVHGSVAKNALWWAYPAEIGPVIYCETWLGGPCPAAAQAR